MSDSNRSIQLSEEEAMQTLELLSKLPYREVQGLFKVIAIRIKELDDPKIVGVTNG